MQICWDNLNDLKMKYNKKKGYWNIIFKSGRRGMFKYIEACKTCGDPFLADLYSRSLFCSQNCNRPSEVSIQKNRESHTGKFHSEESRKKMSKQRSQEKHSNWKGGVCKKNIPLYDTYAQQISWCESVRRDPEDEKILQVKCTYCGKWYRPTTNSISLRIRSITGKINSGESRLYCSNECKYLCPIFHKIKYSAEETNTKQFSREVQPELRQIVFERDNWTCIKCNDTNSLQCHHIEGIYWEPLESADMDKCVTLCKDCHEKVHEIEGCKPFEMRCYKKGE